MKTQVGCVLLAALVAGAARAGKPNVVLVMADDQGWGQTGYNNHPVLKTPHIDAMAANGLRFDRFYAGAPNCSPTRATVLTGRSNDRGGVRNHGYALRLQEKTLPQALRQAGYATGHFGKWHLNGFTGPGAPVLAEDDHNPGAFGFDEWLSMSNFFDRDPLMSRKGRFEEFKGDSSEIVVAEALRFVGRQAAAKRPFFAVVWYGSPHSPWRAADEDRRPFAKLKDGDQHHHGELAAMDRSIGALRQGLRDLGVAENTLVWYCSDNGGLPGVSPGTVGGLRGFKGSLFEGGLRVPCVVEWPAVIRPRITSYPAATLDIFPTVAEIAGLPATAMLQPQDGLSLRALFDKEIDVRAKPIPFRHTGRLAWVDNDYKLVAEKPSQREFQFFNLKADPGETTDLSVKEPAVAGRLREALATWDRTVDASVAGRDYPEGQVSPKEPPSRPWAGSPLYKPYEDGWKSRPEYAGVLGKRAQERE